MWGKLQAWFWSNPGKSHRRVWGDLRLPVKADKTRCRLPPAWPQCPAWDPMALRCSGLSPLIGFSCLWASFVASSPIYIQDHGQKPWRVCKVFFKCRQLKYKYSSHALLISLQRSPSPLCIVSDFSADHKMWSEFSPSFSAPASERPLGSTPNLPLSPLRFQGGKSASKICYAFLSLSFFSSVRW